MANNSLPSRSKNETVSQIKRPKYEQKYKADYVREFKGITKSRTGDTYAFCTICRSDLNIAHGGRDDIKKHLGTKKHANAATAAAAQPSISPFVSPDRSLAVTRAELLFTSFLVEHNIGHASVSILQITWFVKPSLLHIRLFLMEVLKCSHQSEET